MMKVLLEMDLTFRSANLRVLAEELGLSAVVETDLRWSEVFELNNEGPTGPSERHSLLWIGMTTKAGSCRVRYQFFWPEQKAICCL